MLLPEKKWSKLLGRIKAHNYLTASINNKAQTRLLGHPISTLKAIDYFYPELLEKEKLHVVIPGSFSIAEMLDKGRFFNICRVICPSVEFHFTLLYNEDSQFGEPTLPAKLKEMKVGHPVNIEIIRGTLQEYILESGSDMDIVVMHQPGFETHGDSWFEGGVLNALFEKGVPIVGSSYSTDEGTLDAYYLRTIGLDLDIIDNPFKVRDHMSGLKEMDDMIETMGQLWRIKKAKGVDGEAIREMLNNHKYYLPMLFDDMEEAFLMKGHLFFRRYNKNYIRLPNDLVFNMSDFCIENKHGEVVLDDIEIDSEVLSLKDEYINKVPDLIGTYVWFEYQDELESLNNHGTSSMMDGMESFLSTLTEGDDESLRSMMDFISPKPDHKMTKEQVDVGKKVKSYLSGDKTALEDVSSSSLTEYMNVDSQNLLHIAAKHNNIGLAKIALANDVDISASDRDDFSPLDVSAEKGALDVTKLYLYSGADLHRKCKKGFNATSRARTYGHKHVYDYLTSQGGEDTHGYAAEMMKEKGLF